MRIRKIQNLNEITTDVNHKIYSVIGNKNKLHTQTGLVCS